MAGWAMLLTAATYAVVSAMRALNGSPQAAIFTEQVVVGSIEEAVLANGVLEPARIVSVAPRYRGS